MRAIVPIAAGLLSAIAGGCVVQSVHPFYTDDAEIETPGLAGEWRPDGGSSSNSAWFFSGDEISIVEREEEDGGLIHTSVVKATYFKVNDSLFLDTTCDPDELKLAWNSFHVVPVHMLCRIVNTNRDVLLLQPLNAAPFRSASETNRPDIPTIPIGSSSDAPVLSTAVPEQWIGFLREHGADSRFFVVKDALTLKRRPAAAGAAVTAPGAVTNAGAAKGGE